MKRMRTVVYDANECMLQKQCRQRLADSRATGGDVLNGVYALLSTQNHIDQGCHVGNGHMVVTVDISHSKIIAGSLA